MSLAVGVLCLFLRAVRLRLLDQACSACPRPPTGQLSAFLFGRGLNLFFPFGPGELGTIRMLTDNGAPQAPAAAAAVFYNRVFEILAITVVPDRRLHLSRLGRRSRAVLLDRSCSIAGVVSLTRPLGRAPGGRRVLGPLATSGALSAETRS